MKNVLWCIGFISGQTCYLNMTQEEAELRWRAENDGEIETIQKVEFDDVFTSYLVHDGWDVPPVTPDPYVPPYVPPPPRKTDEQQVDFDDPPPF